MEPPPHDLDDLSELLEQLLDAPTDLCPVRIAAGRRRAEGAPVPADELAAAVVAEARHLVDHS